MKINLADIPEEGKRFLYNRQTAELNGLLRDLLGDTPYQTEFFIKPLNSKDFEMMGTIKTELPEVCSRCGLDFNLKVDQAFREILIPRQEDSRTGKYAKVNHVSEALEEGPSVTEYDGMAFDIGEYLHEVVAISTPFNPVAPENDKGDCSICGIQVRGRSFNYDEKMPDEKPESPFAVLKNMKLN